MHKAILMLCLLFCIKMQAQRNILPKDTASIRFDNTFWDMGAIKIDTQAEHTFTFTNTGKNPVFITRAQGSGGCAVISDYTKEPVLPGQQGIVKVIIRCCSEGSIRKEFTVANNADNTPAILTLKAFVVKEEPAQQNDTQPEDTAAIRFDHTEWNFGKIKANTAVEHIFTFTNTGKIPVVITRAQNSGGCAIISYYTNEPVLPGKQGRIKINMRCNQPGIKTRQFDIYTNVSDTPAVLTIRAEMVQEEAAPVELPSQK